MSNVETLGEMRKYVPCGFRDDDGVWHDGPHRLAYDDALAALAAELEQAHLYEKYTGRKLAVLRAAVVEYLRWLEANQESDDPSLSVMDAVGKLHDALAFRAALAEADA